MTYPTTLRARHAALGDVTIIVFDLDALMHAAPDAGVFVHDRDDRPTTVLKRDLSGFEVVRDE